MDYHAPLIVPMSSPDFGDEERQAVMSVLQTTSLSMGSHTLAFEEAFRQFTGSKYALSVNSGTAGLHLCVHAAGIKAGDYVITTPFSFVASTNVILYENATPIFVDVDPQTGNIDPELVAAAAGDLKKGGSHAKRWLPRRGAAEGGQLKAMLAVEVFGQPYDYDALRLVAAANQIKMIDDSCESLGAEYKGKKSGTLGDYGVFAFYPNKQITTGEGGVVVTSDDEAGRIMTALRNQGRAPGDTWLDHTYLGYNYRMDEMSAALGAVQMRRIEELLQKRQRVADWYKQKLSAISGVSAPVLVPSTTRPSWFVYVIRLAPKISRAGVADKLSKSGIPVRPYFSPIHLHPFMRERFGYQAGDFPITEDLGNRGLALPFSGVMSEAQVDLVCKALAEAVS